MSKNIVLCSDGTGNTAIKGRGTNVFKLYEALDLKLETQVAFYDDGVGTERLRPLAALGGAFGFGLSRNVRQLYTALARVYERGDRIFLFGFSRGAFTVRTLAGFIAACGIVDRERCRSDDGLEAAVKETYSAYRDRYRTALMRLLRGKPSDQPETVKRVRKEFAVQHDARPKLEAWQVPIAFIGVWDTVDAVGFPVPFIADAFNTLVYPYKFPNWRLGPTVMRARHALAIDDQRTPSTRSCGTSVRGWMRTSPTRYPTRNPGRPPRTGSSRSGSPACTQTSAAATPSRGCRSSRSSG